MEEQYSPTLETLIAMGEVSEGPQKKPPHGARLSAEDTSVAADSGAATPADAEDNAAGGRAADPQSGPEALGGGTNGNDTTAAGTTVAPDPVPESICCICQESITPGAEGRCGACMTMMHAGCLVAMTADRTDCPACRADLRTCGYLVGGRTIRPAPAQVEPPPRTRAKGQGKGKQAATIAGYEVIESPPIQIVSAERLANTQFGKTKVWGEMDAMTLVHYVKLRASRTRDEGRVIHTTDYYKLSDLARELSLDTRLYSGYNVEKDASLPTSISAERAKGVPDCLLGRSVLQLPKVCRSLFFVDSPVPVLEHDLMVAHLRAALCEAESRSVLCRELRAYVQTPAAIEATRASLAAQTGTDVAQIKALYNAAGYGSRGYAFEEATGQPVPAQVAAVRDTMDQTAAALYAEATPEERAACDRRKGKTTYLSLRLQVKERVWVGRAAAMLQNIPYAASVATSSTRAAATAVAPMPSRGCLPSSVSRAFSSRRRRSARRLMSTRLSSASETGPR